MYSLDILLGVVGGLSSIVWGFIALIFNGYEEFKLQNSLISKIYPVQKTSYDPKSKANKSYTEQQQHAQRSMIKSIFT